MPNKYALCKIINAQKAKIINNFRNTKEKLLRANAAIWYNKICKANQLTPKYVQIKATGDNQQSKNTRLAATRYRLNQEIKFLYKKKQVLNERLFKAHLECANTCDNIDKCLQMVKVHMVGLI
jgi:hypothetical protein